MTLGFLVSKLVRLLGVLLAAQIFFIRIALPAFGATIDSRAEWEKTVNAAKAEGRLTLYNHVAYETIFAEFEKKYPEIKVVYVSGRGAPDLGPRLLSEQRAGKYIGDLFAAGTTAGVLPAGCAPSTSTPSTCWKR